MQRYWRYLMCLWVLLFLSDIRGDSGGVDAFLKTRLSNQAQIQSQKIKIPGYSNAYNPSLIPYKGGYLLSFRYASRSFEKAKDKSRTDFSFIGLARLNKKFKVDEKTIQLLNLSSYSSKYSLSAEDARLLSVGERIFIFFNDFPAIGRGSHSSMYFGEIVEKEGMFVLSGSAKLLKYPYATQTEKNWSPFSIEDRLYVIYSDNPRVILEVDVATGECFPLNLLSLHSDWNFGEIRGGTPAYLVGDYFLTFFHSSFPAAIAKKRAFVMGAYLFEKEPPFSIVAMIKAPLGDLKMYTEDNPTKIVFPGGLVVQERLIHVAWGKGDKQIYITTFDKEKLLSSMELIRE